MTVLGFDVSNNNGGISWTAVPRQTYRFALAKATEGTTFRDTFYAGNVTGAQANSLIPGAYHFLNAEDPVQQARHFASQIGHPGAGFLPPVVDFEGPVLSLGRTECVRRLRAFLNEADKLTGRTCGIYLSDSVVDWLGAAWASLSAGRLVWIARYSTSVPVHPCHIWQNNAYGTVPGIGSGGVDLDVFNGTEVQLRAWAGLAPAKHLKPSAHYLHVLHLAKIGKLSRHLLHLLHIGKPV